MSVASAAAAWGFGAAVGPEWGAEAKISEMTKKLAKTAEFRVSVEKFKACYITHLDNGNMVTGIALSNIVRPCTSASVHSRHRHTVCTDVM